MNRFPVLTGILIAIAQFFGTAALAITVLPWFLGVPQTSPGATLGAVALGALAGHLAARSYTHDNIALAYATAAVALVDGLGTLLLHADLGHGLGWGIVAVFSAFMAVLAEHAPTPDLVRRHLVLAGLWGGLALLLGALGSPHGAIVGDLGLLTLPLVIIAYAAVHSAERTGRPASRESLFAAIGLAALAIVLVTPAVRAALSAVVQGVLWVIVSFVTYVIFYPLSGLIEYLMRLLRRQAHHPAGRENLSGLARQHTQITPHVSTHALGPSTAFWAVLGLAAVVALVIWLIGRGHKAPDYKEPDFREEIRPLSAKQRAPARHGAPPTGVRRQYAEALALLDRAGILPMRQRIGRTPAELVQEVARVVAKRPSGSQATLQTADPLAQAQSAFSALSTLYSGLVYAPPGTGAGPTRDREGAGLLAILKRTVHPGHAAAMRKQKRRGRKMNL